MHSSVALHHLTGGPIEQNFYAVIEENEQNYDKQKEFAVMCDKILEKKAEPLTDEGRQTFSQAYNSFKNDVTGYHNG